jgi:dimethylhistidine N-methyltransferase
MSQQKTAVITEVFVGDVQRGLSSTPKYLLAKYFYDKIGSDLFEEITRQPEYYPTRTDAAILKSHATDIRDALDGDINLVELGSGSSLKTTILLESILEEQARLHYLPIDISPKMLEQTAEHLDSSFDDLAVIAIPSEYGAGLGRANQIISEEEHLPDRKLILFLGSSIGNLEPGNARSFLRMIREKMMMGDGLLVGFDLQKDHLVLNAAYNDRAGVTARFNLNVLTRINRELGGEFPLESFFHRAFYNETEGRIEMHLVSEIDQDVPIRELGASFRFTAGESIHTENSYKYTLDQIIAFARDAGLDVKRVFMDDKKWFAVALMTPA